MGASDMPASDASPRLQRDHMLETVKEQTEYPSSKFGGSTLHLGSNFDLLDDEDEDFRNFQHRKETIMTNITSLAQMKYSSNVAKQKRLIGKVKDALEVQ